MPRDISRGPLILRSELFAALPPEWPEDVRPLVREQVRASGEMLFVLDDDPTGTQTVHGVPVLTEWSVESLRRELASGSPCAYVLTNSRSHSPPDARALNLEVGRNLSEAARLADRPVAVVSRSDSTLRGHFPGEVEALEEGLGRRSDAWLLIPYFEEGGRYTVGDVHYVADGEWLVPAGETESARDAAFGYRSSNLRAWVEEKTGGLVRARDVASVSIEDVRLGGPDAVAARLDALPRGSVCAVNVASARDLEVFVSGLLRSESGGRSYLYRTAASFVPVRAGLLPRPLLSPAELALPPEGGGLTVVGSYVPRTTAQLGRLLARGEVRGIEVDVRRLLSSPERAAEIGRVAAEANAALRKGEDVVLFTSREVLLTGDAGGATSAFRRVSEALVGIVRAIQTRPRYLVAKGGITSSDVASGGLGVRRAAVLGQLLPGVPVWRCGAESAWPGLAYVVFPGNVGGPEALADVVDSLRAGRPEA